jgi:nucleoside-diphosphate-sugar epimerase
MPESYLIIGGSGLLGGHIIDQLLARGETSVATFDVAPAECDKRVRVFVGDICDRTAVEDVVKEVRHHVNSGLLNIHLTKRNLFAVCSYLYHSHGCSDTR